MSSRRVGTTDGLCYLPARDVEIPAGTLAGMDLCGSDDQKLGTLDGVLIDAAERRVRYFVVESQGWLGKKRYLLSADETAHLEPAEGVLRVDVDAEDPWRYAFDADAVPVYSEDDLMSALFQTRPRVN
jgi:hypothetical protein